MPPVHLNISPALSEEELETQFNKKVYSVTLKDVVRQQAASGILYNATSIRELLVKEDYLGFNFNLERFNDVHRILEGNELLEALENTLQEDGVDQTVLIVRSNKRANLFNRNIRERILYLESDLSVGDQLMVVKNNYFWLDANSQPGFIANGDVVKINQISKYVDRYDMKFAEVKCPNGRLPRRTSF